MQSGFYIHRNNDNKLVLTFSSSITNPGDASSYIVEYSDTGTFSGEETPLFADSEYTIAGSSANTVTINIGPAGFMSGYSVYFRVRIADVNAIAPTIDTSITESTDFVIIE